ncbi:hypothetical protein FNV43_RR09414 [Rhamnella rubrinervis]|uniref:RING-type E3 ubiquitin transferase n=1 Tax=Rhamnella rubrinervis TaxID=2594499 RepID=A0A8K0MJT0_9ROSA|nr:hypothetical protein FNV43_RR09414 [Rhamnella rubrinervis]
MATSIEISVFSIFFFFLLFHGIAANSVITCQERSCSQDKLPVRFPFRLEYQSSRCGFPGFGLSCDKQNQTILTLGDSEQQFAVRMIEYQKQIVWINDPDGCFPRRFLNHDFNVSKSPFSAYDHMENYTFVNCSSSQELTRYVFFRIACLSDYDYTVYAIPTIYAPPVTPGSDLSSPSPSLSSSCSVITTALVPLPLPLRHQTYPPLLDEDIRLTWEEPGCGSCESRGGNCGFQRNDFTVVGCSVSSNSRGLSRAATYGIILVAVIPGLLCTIGLAGFVVGKIKAYEQRRRPQPNSDGPQPAVVVMGLDGPTIESYPKTLLGESRRLPRPSENTCPICLSEYQPKEELRTIPECNHYFHAGCVDEWLKMNATCPLCRHSPEGSSHGVTTDSSSIASGAASSSNTSSSSLV